MGFFDVRPACPFCAREGSVHHNVRKTPAGWVCGRCGRVFSVKRGSLFDLLPRV